MSDNRTRLKEAKRAADASKAAGLCPVCDHAPHRDTPCPGCHCRWHKSFNSDLERLAEARHSFAVTFSKEVVLPLLRFFRVVR